MKPGPLHDADALGFSHDLIEKWAAVGIAHIADEPTTNGEPGGKDKDEEAADEQEAAATSKPDYENMEYKDLKAAAKKAGLKSYHTKKRETLVKELSKLEG